MVGPGGRDDVALEVVAFELHIERENAAGNGDQRIRFDLSVLIGFCVCWVGPQCR
jgi:hypothetical protein